MPVVDDNEYRDKMLRCPFCLEHLVCEEDIDNPYGSDIDGGICSCGAAFVYDRTGKNQGEAFSDALGIVFNWEYDAAFAAGEGDYEDATVRFNVRVAKYLLEEGGPLDRNPNYVFVRRKSKD